MRNANPLWVGMATALLGCMAAGAGEKPRVLDPRLVELVVRQQYEAVFPKSYVEAVWPSVFKWWQGEEAGFRRVFEGSPLKPGVRLVIVGPTKDIPSVYGLLLQVGNHVEPLMTSTTFHVAGREATDEIEEDAWDRVQSQLVVGPKREEDICKLPAEDVARFYAFLATSITHYEPQSLLLTRQELLRPGRPWLDAPLRKQLEPLLMDVGFRPYAYQPSDACVLGFRTWKPESGHVFEWLGVLPANPASLVRINLRLDAIESRRHECRGPYGTEEAAVEQQH